MPYQLDDTIAAIATAPGGAMRGVIRLSGPDVAGRLQTCFHADNGVSLEKVRRATATAGQLLLGGLGGRLPCQVYLWPTARSYTGQPVAEVHTIGSVPLVEAVLRTVYSAGVRPAEPGEFTLRAFLAGRVDLTQAEAVLGVIDAAGPRDLDVALAQLAGGLARPLGTLRNKLIDLLAHLEAGLDFVEEDIEFVTAEQLKEQLQAAAEKIAAIARQMSTRADGITEPKVVLVGYPNVGKSSLLNVLAGQAAAIVSDLPGTTRDYVAIRVECDGVAYLLIDTAGREPDRPVGSISAAAQQMAGEQSGQAQLELLCLDCTRPLNAWERAELDREPSAGRLLVLTKTDSPRATDLARPAVETSSKTHDGCDTLRRTIGATIASSHPSRGVVAGTAARCHDSLRLAGASLDRAKELVDGGAGEELVAIEVRTALDELGVVVGAVYTDDLFDRIFSRFCIGK